MASSYNFGVPTNQIVDRISQVSASAVTSGVIYVDRENETLHRSNGVTWTEIGNLTDLTKGEFLWKLYNLTGTDEDGLDVEGVAFGGTDGTVTSDGTKLIYDTATESLSLLKGARGYTFSDPIGNITGSETGLYYGFQSANKLELLYNGTRQLYTDSTGRVYVNNLGVGTATGGAASPQINFGGSTTAGIYLNSGGALAFATSGTRRFEIQNNYIETTIPFYLPNGSVTAPAVVFNSSTGTGLYKTGAGFSASVSGTNTLDIHSGLLRIPNSLRYINDTDTGIDVLAGNDVAMFVAGGTQQGGFHTEGFVAKLGSAAAPSYAFFSPGPTPLTIGLYASSTSGVSVGIDGTEVARFNSNRIATTDSVRFLADTDTGVDRTGANEITVVVSGENTLQIMRDKVEVGDTETIPSNSVNLQVDGIIAVKIGEYQVPSPSFSGVASFASQGGHWLITDGSSANTDFILNGITVSSTFVQNINGDSFIVPVVIEVVLREQSSAKFLHSKSGLSAGQLPFYLKDRTEVTLLGPTSGSNTNKIFMANFVCRPSSSLSEIPAGVYQVSDFIEVVQNNF